MTLREFYAQIQQTTADPMIPVRIIASEEIARLPREQADSRISALLHQVRVRPEFVWYGSRSLARLVTPPPRTALLGHNTLVEFSLEFSLPYTLHLPSEMPLQMTRPQAAGRATIVLRKVWTELAADSNDAEIYADAQLLYYGPTQLQSPTTAQAPELGPWPRFTGTNIEIAKDTHGVFRYSRVRVLFDSTVAGIGGSDDDETVKTARSAALDEATKAGLEIVNYLLDVYRYVTGEEHVERLSTTTVNCVYFADHNLISEGARIESGLGTAIVNRSRREIERIKGMLSAGEEPERHMLLIQSSRAALDRGQLVLAVVVAFQALEILLETKLRAGYARQGLSEDDVTDKLRKRYKTKDRLTLLCREVTGGKSVANDTTFWNLWLTDCNRKRDRVVHRNEAVTHAEALKVLELCEQCIARLSAFPFPE